MIPNNINFMKNIFSNMEAQFNKLLLNIESDATYKDIIDKMKDDSKKHLKNYVPEAFQNLDNKIQALSKKAFGWGLAGIGLLISAPITFLAVPIVGAPLAVLQTAIGVAACILSYDFVKIRNNSQMLATREARESFIEKMAGDKTKEFIKSGLNNVIRRIHVLKNLSSAEEIQSAYNELKKNIEADLAVVDSRLREFENNIKTHFEAALLQKVHTDVLLAKRLFSY
jgi:hypothetical protein